MGTESGKMGMGGGKRCGRAFLIFLKPFFYGREKSILTMENLSWASKGLFLLLPFSVSLPNTPFLLDKQEFGEAKLPKFEGFSLCCLLQSEVYFPLSPPPPPPPTSSYVESLTRVSKNVTVFGERAFQEVIKWALIQSDWCPCMKRRLGQRHQGCVRAEGKTLWRDSKREAKEKPKGGTPEATKSVNTLILDF